MIIDEELKPVRVPSFEELVSEFPDPVRERAIEDLEKGYSVYGQVDGKPRWVNPDKTVSETPTSCLLADPEE